MQQYGDFPSDVDTRKVTIRQRYPGCGCVLETSMCREELYDYTRQPDGTYIGLGPSGECARHLEIESLRQEWQAFVQQFADGHGSWTPSREEWLRHEVVGRDLLLLILVALPDVSSEHIAHARTYLDPARWSAFDFLERVVPVLAERPRRQ